MNRMAKDLAAGIAAVLSWPAVALAQPMDTIGTRATGMGGAYVAVADDASAVYWNPAGFAAGSYFSLVLDRYGAEVNPADSGSAESRSGLLIALGTPALGLSYYRLRNTALSPSPAVGAGGNGSPLALVRIDTLISHHAGVTLVQSLGSNVAVGGTLKLVRGIASSVDVPDRDHEALLSEANDLAGKSTTRFDGDLGVMATLGLLKAGLTVRNVSEPSFEAAGVPRHLELLRQARAGVSLHSPRGWLVSADVDLLKGTGPFGETQDLAFGGEARVVRRLLVRAGMHFNMVGSSSGELAPSVGGSYAIKATFLVDAQASWGSNQAPHGWGIGARFVY